MTYLETGLRALYESGDIGDTWRKLFEEDKDLLVGIGEKIERDIADGEQIFPAAENVFAAFRVPAEQVRVIILGQDPYHTPGMATGLAFSVPESMPAPPSLKNIQKELESDIGPGPYPKNLSGWAEQGVFLLNTALTVIQGEPGSHAKYGWDAFVRHAIHAALHADTGPLAAVLWGNYARKYHSLFEWNQYSNDFHRNLMVLLGPHPSPLSAYRGFFGSKPFSGINRFLEENGNAPIDWRR